MKRKTVAKSATLDENARQGLIVRLAAVHRVLEQEREARLKLADQVAELSMIIAGELEQKQLTNEWKRRLKAEEEAETPLEIELRSTKIISIFVNLN
jgi:hypothetical protein